MRWRITIVIYPHSTGNGQEADRKAAGTDGGDHYFYVDAEDFKEAVKMASCYVAALQSHPAVWQTHIMGVHRLIPLEKLP